MVNVWYPALYDSWKRRIILNVYVGISAWDDSSIYIIHRSRWLSPHREKWLVATAKNNILIVENLANLNKIKSKEFDFTILPLKLKDATGSPVRAIAH